MSEEDMSNGEIGRRITDLSETMRSGFAELNSRLDRYVLAEVHTLSINILGERIAKLEVQRASDRAESQGVARWSVSTAVSAVAVVASLVMGVIALFAK